MIETKKTIDSFRHYRRNNKQNPVDLPTYRKITTGFIKFIMSKVFDGYDVDLSDNKSLGTICIRGKKKKITISEDGKVKGLSVDWGNTRKQWAVIAQGLGLTLKEYIANTKDKPLLYHLNEHSDGYSYNILWHKDRMKLVNKSFFSLVFSRANKRTLPKKIREGKEYLIKTKDIHHG